MADRFRKAAIEESKRLMYVSMTRARDLLVLARSRRQLSGEWLDCIEAPWLLPNDECDVVCLPSGERIAAERWLLDPVESADTGEHAPLNDLYWFQSKGATASRLPLNFNPSSAGRF
jgi:hypothetical protein